MFRVFVQPGWYFRKIYHVHFPLWKIWTKMNQKQRLCRLYEQRWIIQKGHQIWSGPLAVEVGMKMRIQKDGWMDLWDSCRTSDSDRFSRALTVDWQLACWSYTQHFWRPRKMNELHKRRISPKSIWLYFYSAPPFQTDFRLATNQIDLANNSFFQKKKKNKGFPASYLTITNPSCRVCQHSTFMDLQMVM